MQIPRIAQDNPRAGNDIVEVETLGNNVYIQAKNGDIWRISIDWDNRPIIESVAMGAPLSGGQ